jgi:uncharacterized protein (TIGR00251 family)
MNAKLGSRVAIRVQPGAKKDAVLGKQAEAWKISVRAPAVEGKANRACVAFLAKLLNVRRSSVALIKGEKSRDKVFEFKGLADHQISAVFRSAMGA